MPHRVLVDADACPRSALAIVETVCKEYGWTCLTYASYNHLRTGPNHTVVDAEPQAVDIKLTNDTLPGDIVVTQDIGLAALILAKQAKALSPHGEVFSHENIAFQLEKRNEQARYRRGGGRTRGPSARTGKDDQRFAASLRLLLAAADERE
ncbi:DUF188 domain-containing protein [Brevibacillus sp. B_LB10_24]|uniref:DUF188 domain-containing protein n=1 Tax=Brevibacillus TaxID=55080 RepID=UPI0002EA460F|nr:DUF188 domain-containing protein [Brevibacillus massiliensis]